MAVEAFETKLVAEYEAIRRQEYEILTDILEVLPKIDNLEAERLEQVRDALFHADHPFLAVFIGPFSAGKSSIINALLGKDDLLPVGPVPTTDRISILRWGDEPDTMNSGGDVDTVFYPSPLLKKVSFVDTPGLESVFREHEEITRKFLHRSDLVLLVMLATQAMSAGNLEYLQKLKGFGKKVIVLINQVDLLTPEDAGKVREYVLDQSQLHLGLAPEVWLVSAKQGLAARGDETPDRAAWEASGLDKIEEYIDRQLSDVARLRQKLQTPLQIAQNVGQSALVAVRENQSALDHYQSISENIEQQLQVDRHEQERIVRETNAAIEKHFTETARRGSAAIRESLRFSRALQSVTGGVLGLVGLAGLLRRVQGGSYIRHAFEQHNAFEPIDELSATVEKLAPRLEGKDMQDIDDLVKYAQRESGKLPPVIQEKVIGRLQSPVQYEREALQGIRSTLEQIEDEARLVETEKIERAFHNTLLYVAVWEVLVIVFGVALISTWGSVASSRPELPVIVLLVLLGLGLLGLAFLPLRGRVLGNQYTNRLTKLQARYVDSLGKAADRQIAYGMQLRRECVAPLTRLVSAQTEIQREQLTRLQAAEHAMVKIESALSALGKRKFPGL